MTTQDIKEKVSRVYAARVEIQEITSFTVYAFREAKHETFLNEGDAKLFAYIQEAYENSGDGAIFLSVVAEIIREESMG